MKRRAPAVLSSKSSFQQNFPERESGGTVFALCISYFVAVKTNKSRK